MSESNCMDCKHLTKTEPNGTYAVCDKRKWQGKQPVTLMDAYFKDDCEDFMRRF